MKLQFILMLAAVISLLALLALPAIRLVAKQFTHNLAANAFGDGTHVTGTVYRVTEAAFTTRNLIAKKGSAAGAIVLGTAGSLPIGVVPDEPASGDTAQVCLFGAHAGTLIMTAGAAIAEDALVSTSASGKIITLPATTGTYYQVGRALTAAAADGDPIEIEPCFPLKVVIP